MCGICGWVGCHASPVSDNIDRMVTALSNRGPDDSGTWAGSDGRCVLGHTRLSIIDLGGSRQPMENEDGTVVVTYNGEIYNYRELRAFLVGKGHSFRTQGDTEVLVHLYEEYGSAMVEHLDGMFAFALYDTTRLSLLLARDPIGIKPLYYWHNTDSHELFFASDLNSMLANRAVPRHFNPRALAQYLHFGFVVHPQSWLQDVYQVQPGETVEWRDGILSHRRYYSWQYEPQDDLASMGKATDRLRHDLYNSAASHLVADVPLGSFLSGGLDSTTITGFAQQIRRESRDDINSFTVQFWVAEHDESARARAIAADLGTHHTEIRAKELEFNRCSIDRLISGLGEPFADTSALAVYLLCQQARPYVKVALSGDGGDELFFGYTGFYKQRLARHFRFAPAGLRRTLVNLTAGSRSTLPRRANKYARLSLLSDADLIIDWHRRWEWDELVSLLGPDLFHSLYPDPSKPFPELCERIGNGGGGGFLEQQIRFHLEVVLPCDGLFKVDRMSMAHGLEVRVPMLSNNLLDYARHLPLSMRAHGKRTKEPLRTVAESLSPTVMQPSPKRGFSFPLDLWVRGKIGEYWREWDLSPALRNIGFQTSELDRLLNRYGRFDATEHGYDTQSLSTRLFDLMLVALWLDYYQVTE